MVGDHHITSTIPSTLVATFRSGAPRRRYGYGYTLNRDRPTQALAFLLSLSLPISSVYRRDCEAEQWITPLYDMKVLRARSRSLAVVYLSPMCQLTCLPIACCFMTIS